LSIDNYQETLSYPENDDDKKKFITQRANEFYSRFAPSRWSKKQWNTLINKFVDEFIEKRKFNKVPLDKLNGYIFITLKNAADHHDYKSSVEYDEYKETMLDISDVSVENTNRMIGRVPFYNWLDQ
ncbi:hypothetical protein ACTSEZ_21195, partial [Metabacillus sp. JX24]